MYHGYDGNLPTTPVWDVGRAVSDIFPYGWARRVRQNGKCDRVALSSHQPKIWTLERLSPED